MPDAPPHSGDKYAACFNAVLPATNDDWLFTPQLSSAQFDQVSFWARSYTGDYNLDRFEVGVSTTDTVPSSFTIISSSPYIEAPVDWTEYVYDISSYSGDIYIGIHCVSYDAFFLMLDDFSVTGSGAEPLTADADGPYEAFVDEDIQFEGSATGGTPPYSFYWDFGNGDTSDEEDPVYAYDEAGVYQVTLTVTDSVQDTDDDPTTATVNEKPCCFEVLIPPGFGFGLKAEVTEICNESHTEVPWKFEVTGGIVIPISTMQGTADFAAGETKTLRVFLILGLGSIQIKFTINDCDPTVVEARIIGPFVIVK